MRKALTSLLLAAVALTPVAATAQDSGSNRFQRFRGGESRSVTRSETRQQRSEQRTQRREESSQATRDYDRGQARAEARAQVQVQQQQQQQQVVRQQADRSGSRWSGRGNGERQQAEQQQQQTQQAWSGRRGGGGSQGWQGRGGNNGDYQRQVEATREASRRSAEGLSPRYQQQAERNQQRYERDQRDGYQRGDRDRDGRDGRNGQWSSRDGNRDGHRGNWNRNWRNDNRYDWQRYRYANRSLFSSGRYYAPYRNYRYNRLSIGLILGSAFYADQYWLSDPWQYRLPPAYPGTQWVRYYDDVLLVDVYSGEVLDVIYDFFY